MRLQASTPEICLWEPLAASKPLQTISESIGSLIKQRAAHFMQNIPDDFSYARLTSYFDTPQVAATVRSPDCLLGMLTAVASAPAELLPEDWLDLIFLDDIDDNPALQNPERWLDGLIQELISWWLDCLSSLDKGDFVLPEHLVFEENGAVPKALKEFAEGYIIASDWSDELWQQATPDEEGIENDLRMAALTALVQCVKEELRNEEGAPDLVARMIAAQKEDFDSDIDAPFTLSSLLCAVGHLGRQRSEELRQPREPYINPNRETGRNDPCPCGSGKKFKKCCMHS